MALLAALAGCASGEAEDARSAEERARTEEAVLAGIQATNIIEEFFPTPPTPEPSPTTVPVLASLVLTTSLGAGNEPRGEVESVRMGSTVYAAAQISYLSAGQRVIAVWTTADGAELARSEAEVERSARSTWVPLQWTAGGGPFGGHAVFIYVEDVLLDSLTFQVV